MLAAVFPFILTVGIEAKAMCKPLRGRYYAVLIAGLMMAELIDILLMGRFAFGITRKAIETISLP
jgi:hypothetical protein